MGFAQMPNAPSQVADRDARGAAVRAGEPDRLLSSPDDIHPTPEGYRLLALALDLGIKTCSCRNGGS